MSTVTFDTVKGSVAGHANVDKLMLTAVSLDMVFDHIDDYMQSDVEQAREDASLQTLLREGAIVASVDAECGYQMTELGKAILDLPYGYEQSRLVALAPDWMRPYLCVLFSFGSLHSYANHESDGQMALRDPSSEPLSKVLLGIDYLTAQHDSRQRLLADQEGMLFGRLEAMESQSRLAFRALGIGTDSLNTSEVMYQWPAVMDYLIQGDYYQVFPMKKGRRGYMTMITDVDQAERQYMISNDQLRWSGEYVLVAGRPLWFESRRGNPCAFVDDASLVESQKYTDQVADQASNWGWQRVEISDGGGRINGAWYSLSRQSQYVSDGQYWVRLDRWRRQIKLEVMWPAE